MHPGSSQEAVAPSRPRAGGGQMRVRLRGLALAAPCVVIVALASTLSPRSVGYGTHEQLGVPGCSFMASSGYPCPTCGMTTSVAAGVHGQLALAWRAHPFGLVLLGAVAVLAVVGVVELATGRAGVHRLRPGLWWLWAGLAGLFGGWLWLLLTGTINGRWGHH